MRRSVRYAILGSHRASSGTPGSSAELFDAFDCAVELDDGEIVGVGLRTKEYLSYDQPSTWDGYRPIEITLRLEDVSFFDFAEIMWLGPDPRPCLLLSNAEGVTEQGVHHLLFNRPGSKMFDGKEGAGLPTLAELGIAPPDPIAWREVDADRTDPLSPSGREAIARRAVSEWVGREAMQHLVALFGGAPESTRGVEVTQSVPILEEFADYCWNFRQGMPAAALALLKSLKDPSFQDDLPAAAIRERWTGDGALELRNLYFSDAENARRLLSQANLAEEVEAYPASSNAGYRERWQAADLHFNEQASQTIEEAADALDAVTPGGIRTPYDHILVLGGGGRSPLLRCEYTAELLQSHGVEDSTIWFLGSPRPLDETHERELVSGYAPAARTEFDLMSSAAQVAFRLSEGPTEIVCGCADVSVACPLWTSKNVGAPPTPHEFQHQRAQTLDSTDYANLRFRVLSAATSNPPNRPNTADTYSLFTHLAQLKASDRVLVVTTQVFVPFQRFDALRMLTLPFGASADVVGFGAERGDRPNSPEFLLQEILSGIRSARRLLDALPPVVRDVGPDRLS